MPWASWQLGFPWALALLAVVVPWILVRARSIARREGRRASSITLAWLVSAVALVLALAQPELGTPSTERAVVVVLDRSRSVENGHDTTDAMLAALERALPTMREDDRLGLVTFGAESATELLPQRAPVLPTRRATLARDGTHIEGALRRALADLPADATPRVVLISDGLETDGDSGRAVALARGRGVPIDVLPIERDERREVAITRVVLPRVLRDGEPLEARIVTRATVETRVRVRVRRDDVAVAESETTIQPGEDVLTLHERADGTGLHRYDVEIEALDGELDASRENNVASGFVRVTGAPRVLVVADRPNEVSAFVGLLERADMHVTTVVPSAFPASLEELAGEDLVVLADADARGFTEEALVSIATYVRELGGGLLMAGAHDSFGLGGYAQTPVEEVLPTTLDLRQRHDRASLAMVIAIDRSGSMGEVVVGSRTKLDLANEAAARSVEILAPRDRIAVLHVDEVSHVTVPPTSVVDPASTAARVRGADIGGGGIFVDVALRDGYRILRQEETQLAHLLLFADGSDAERMEGCEAVVRAAQRDHITTSVVSMGHGLDTRGLERLSSAGEGRFYIVEDLRELPRVFAEETVIASRAALDEVPFVPVLGAPSDITRGLSVETAPPLAAHVVLNARPEARVLLVARDGDPLLSTMQHGLGRSGAFAADLGAETTRAWLAWEGYGVLFTQLARALTRPPRNDHADVHADIEGGHGHVTVDVLDDEGRFETHLSLVGHVAGPRGAHEDLVLEPTSPGRYEADFDGARPGAYLLSVAREDGTSLSTLGTVGVVRGRGDELDGRGTDHATLARIARATGGTVLTNLEGLFRGGRSPTFAYAPAHRALLVLGLLALFASVVLRRLVLPAWLAARWTAWRTAWRMRRDAPSEGGAPSALEALSRRRDARTKEARSTETAPAREEPSTHAATSRPPGHGAKASGDGTRPSSDGARPSSDGAKASDGTTKPSESTTKPSESTTKPPDDPPPTADATPDAGSLAGALLARRRGRPR